MKTKQSTRIHQLENGNLFQFVVLVKDKTPCAFCNGRSECKKLKGGSSVFSVVKFPHSSYSSYVGDPVIYQNPIKRGIEILVVTSCYRNRDKSMPKGLYADFTLARARISNLVPRAFPFFSRCPPSPQNPFPSQKIKKGKALGTRLLESPELERSNHTVEEHKTHCYVCLYLTL